MEVIIVWCSQANPKKNKMIVQLKNWIKIVLPWITKPPHKKNEEKSI